MQGVLEHKKAGRQIKDSHSNQASLMIIAKSRYNSQGLTRTKNSRASPSRAAIREQFCEVITPDQATKAQPLTPVSTTNTLSMSAQESRQQCPKSQQTLNLPLNSSYQLTILQKILILLSSLKHPHLATIHLV